jgi:MraZ protein
VGRSGQDDHGGPATDFGFSERVGSFRVSEWGTVRMTSLSRGLFRGRFQLKVDSKGRISLPSPYRKAFTKSSQTLVVTNSLVQKSPCLDVYTLKQWEKLEAKIQKLPSLKPSVQAYQRFYLSGGHAIDVDSHNRFLIPQPLRQFATIDSDVMLVGMGHKFEMWTVESWNKLYSSMSNDFESILMDVAELEEGLSLE